MAYGLKACSCHPLNFIFSLKMAYNFEILIGSNQTKCVAQESICELVFVKDSV